MAVLFQETFLHLLNGVFVEINPKNTRAKKIELIREEIIIK